jgi:hypothetical protein
MRENTVNKKALGFFQGLSVAVVTVTAGRIENVFQPKPPERLFRMVVVMAAIDCHDLSHLVKVTKSRG